MLSQAQWLALTRLYGAGVRGFEYDGAGYGEAGSWSTLKALREHDPVLAREITQLDPGNQRTRYIVIITEAGERFYEKKRRLYRALYG